MKTDTTTPASVASLLDDEYIEALANKEAKAGYWETAAVLRDYVRIRGENEQLKARLEAVANDNAKMTDRMLEVINLCNGMKDNFSSWNQGEVDFAQKVLRAARGEGGAE